MDRDEDGPRVLLRESLFSLLHAPRFGQFLSVGVLGAAAESGVLLLLVEVAGLEPVLGAAASKEVAIAVMFALNERFTFLGVGGRSPLQILRRFVRSNLVRSVGVGVALAVLYVLYNFFGVWYFLANVVGIGVGFSVNYTAESLFTWKVHLEDQDPPG